MYRESPKGDHQPLADAACHFVTVQSIAEDAYEMTPAYRRCLSVVPSHNVTVTLV